MDGPLLKKIQEISLSLFRKDFFGLYHGSISLKADSGSFWINKREAIFDKLSDDSMIKINIYNKDHRWNEASIDAGVHEEIYKTISSAKFICHTVPEYTTSYSLHTDLIVPKDYFGQTIIGNVQVYDPKSFASWYDRAPREIANYFLNSENKLMVIRGYGLYCYDRDIYEAIKKMAILEKSCRLLSIAIDD